MRDNDQKIMIIKNGTLIDGSGNEPTPNETVVIEGNRIRSIGNLPEDVKLKDPDDVQVIDAHGRWIMPGLIDAHCHLSFGYPQIPAVNAAKGTTSAEFSTLRAAQNVQTVLRSGVTSISVPGSTWFIDNAVRDAIYAGLIEGPRIFCAGRCIEPYGGISDPEPSWVGTPDHSPGVLANSVTEMITEVRRQCKHGVDLIKMGDSPWGDIQTISKEELSSVVKEAHRRNVRVTIHSRGAGSTRAAAEAGVDWILHADLATEADLEAVAAAGVRVVPTITFLMIALEAGRDFVGDRGTNYSIRETERQRDTIKRHIEGAVTVLEKARSLGLKIMCGTDSGNTSIMEYGKYHAKEAEILVRYGGYTTMEAILACTRDNAFAVGLENDVGVLDVGKLADIIILKADPIADIRVLQNGQYLEAVIKDGKMVSLDQRQDDGNRGLLMFEHAGV